MVQSKSLPQSLFLWIDSSYSKSQLWLYFWILWPTFCCNYRKLCLLILDLHVDRNDTLAGELLLKLLAASERNCTPFGPNSHSGHFILFLFLQVWTDGDKLCTVYMAFDFSLHLSIGSPQTTDRSLPVDSTSRVFPVFFPLSHIFNLIQTVYRSATYYFTKVFNHIQVLWGCDDINGHDVFFLFYSKNKIIRNF